MTYYSLTSQSLTWQPPPCANGSIGLSCNISADPCQMANPCLNNGICIISVHPSSYVCTCMQGFTGRNCEIDIRPGQPVTCMSHGRCVEINLTTFQCNCESGYEGFHCQSLINYCLDVTCYNDGQCRPIRLNFSCECTTTDFAGLYCEIKSSSLASKQAINRGFGYIAILALASVAITIVLMDVMKYGFRIDPVQKERKRVAERRRRQRFAKSKSRLVQRFIYVNPPMLESIPEEA